MKKKKKKIEGGTAVLNQSPYENQEKGNNARPSSYKRKADLLKHGNRSSQNTTMLVTECFFRSNCDEKDCFSKKTNPMPPVYREQFCGQQGYIS